MALDAATIIRTGSAALFGLLGIAILFVAKRNKGALALAVFLIVHATSAIFNNLDARAAPSDLLVGAALTAGIGVTAFAAAILVPGTLDRRERAAPLIGLAAGVASLAGILQYERLDALQAASTTHGMARGAALAALAMTLIYIVGFVGMIVTLAARVALAPPTEARAWTRAAAMSFLVGPYLILFLPTLTARASAWVLVAMLAFVGSLAVLWLTAAARSGNRLALRVAVAWPALGLFSFLYLALPANQTARFSDAWGLFGIERAIGWSILVYAILRADLLRVPLPHFAVSRGGVAAGALATLFIVAQIAQNFFSAEYGLLTGGVVAGAFLFAASPLQRAIESMRAPERPATREVPAGGTDARLATYRDAVRYALRDGTVTRKEEAHLADLAQHLGIGAGDAMRVRHEVEDEISK